MTATAIEYADVAWPIVTGCSHVSPGCDNCYAARLASGRLKHRSRYKGLATGGRWTGEVQMHEDLLDQPYHWKKPRRVFVAQMGDLFHPKVSDAFITRAFRVMADCPQHQFLLLTKRALHMVRLSLRWRVRHEQAWPQNIWLGITCENQQMHDCRMCVCSGLSWISCEPLVGPLSIYPEFLAWVVVGCESGPRRRSCKLEWVRDIVQQCRAKGTPVFVKQVSINGKVSRDPTEWPEDLRVQEYPEEMV